jgi:hypothetical protein
VSVIRHRNTLSWAALATSMLALIMSTTGLGAARTGRSSAASTVRLGADGKIPISELPHIPTALLPRIPARLLAHIPGRLIGTVAHARNADKLGDVSASRFEAACPAGSVDIGTWCLDDQPYALTAQQAGLNSYFFATHACVNAGGFLPSAGQLIGAAAKVPLESVITDSPTTATIDTDPTNGLSDQREMSSTLVTVAAGSDAAGSEGVSIGATGNPKLGQPDPTPQPAVPQPETLQYVTVYGNSQKGGFAGSEPVSAPENFRCAYNKVSSATTTGNGARHRP